MKRYHYRESALAVIKLTAGIWRTRFGPSHFYTAVVSDSLFDEFFDLIEPARSPPMAIFALASTRVHARPKQNSAEKYRPSSMRAA